VMGGLSDRDSEFILRTHSTSPGMLKKNSAGVQSLA